MIDEKKLIEEIRKHPLEFAESDIGIGLRFVTDIIDNQPKVGEWIPCSERLPEKNRPVLVFGHSKCRGGDITMVGACANGCWFIQSSQNTLGFPCSEYEVIAWQPLPEPYKG